MCTLLVTFLQNVTLCVAYVTKISDHSLSIFSSILSPTACDHTIYMCHVFCITRNFYKIKCKLLYWQLAARTRAYFLTSIKVQVIEACVILYWKNNCFTWLAHLGLLPLRFSSLSLTESAINKETTATKWKPKRIRRQKGKSRKNPTTTNVCSEVKWLAKLQESCRRRHHKGSNIFALLEIEVVGCHTGCCNIHTCSEFHS